ncbi:MAG TPA: hypothetical protein VMS17_17970 [Gemmataceae bacterium]|nr:hypothetical protein [Gemmataceae bacterium]
MTRFFGWLGAAGACLCLLGGCTLDSFSLNAFGTTKGDPVVAASLDATAAMTQKAFNDLQIFFVMNRTDDATVKIAAQSPSGKRFTLLLKARKTDHGDETQLTIHWDKDADDAFWLRLAAAIAAPQPPPANPFGGSERAAPLQPGASH